MENIIEFIYPDNIDEEEATKRVKVVPYEDPDIGNFICTGRVLFVENRDIGSFYRKLNNQGREYNEEVITSGGLIFDGTEYWAEGPSTQDGDFFLAFNSRKEAREYKDSVYSDIKHFLNGVYGYIYEEKCPCCGTWEEKDSLWGIIGHTRKYALEYMRDYAPINII